MITTIRRPGFRGSSRPIVTPQSLGSSLKLWLRADLGWTEGTRTWVNQAPGGQSFVSAGAPTRTTAAEFGGQQCIQFAAGGADTLPIQSIIGAVPAPFCWLAVFRILSGVAGYNIVYTTGAQGQLNITPGTGAVYIATATDNATTNSPGALGTAGHALMVGSGANVGSLDGTALTHTALTGTMVLLSPDTNVGYSVDSSQIAEVILATTSTLANLAPYIKARYGLTL